MKTLLLAAAAALVLTACGKSDTPKAPAPTTGSTATPTAPATPAPKVEEKKDEMKK